MQESVGSFHHVDLKIQTMLSRLVAPLKKLLNFYVFYYYCTYVSMLWHSVYGHGLHGVHVGVRGQLC